MTQITEHRPEIVNADPKYGPPAFAEPPTAGFCLLAATIDPPRKGPPFVRPSRRRTDLLAQLKPMVAALEQLDSVTTARLFRAILMPPPAAIARKLRTHPARYDVVVLIETTSVDTLDEVRESESFRLLTDTLFDGADDTYELAAHCPRRIADVDTSRQGLFLFNYFAADDPERALALWEQLAGWYVAETGLDNSTPLVATDPVESDYALVNFARWDLSLPIFAIRQFAKRSFYRYVTANLRANDVGPMPILYRIA